MGFYPQNEPVYEVSMRRYLIHTVSTLAVCTLPLTALAAPPEEEDDDLIIEDEEEMEVAAPTTPDAADW